LWHQKVILELGYGQGQFLKPLESILRGPVLPFLSNLQNQLHFLLLNMSIQLKESNIWTQCFSLGSWFICLVNCNRKENFFDAEST
jgi:hypothetical protein